MRKIARSLVYLSLLSCPLAAEAEDRYYVENGVTYRESREVVNRPVYKTVYEDRDRTVYRHEYETEIRENPRTVAIPRTEYRMKPYVVNRWNVFAPPTVEWRMVPQTVWDTHTEIVERPVTVKRLVPETRTESVPVVKKEYVQEEVIRRVVVDAPPAGGSSLASRPQYGGISRLDKDPPRQGINESWRSAGSTTLR